jgi:hypothetical protein
VGIFRYRESEDFDDLTYYTDDPVDVSAEENPSKNPLKFGFITFISVLGIALGANLIIQVGSNGRLEYGQGFAVTTVCQGKTSPATTMMLTPFAGYENSSGTGKFVIDSILLENIDRDCVGDDFTIRMFSNSSSSPLTLDETATSVGVYQGSQSFRFWWQDSVTATTMSPQYTDVEILNDTSDTVDFLANQNSFLITFNPDQIASFADATQVYKITVESSNHTS